MSSARTNHGTSWLSVHLFFDGGIYLAEADRLVLDVVEPLARQCVDQGWAQRWFFMRYAAGGSHLRFRLDVLPGKEERCQVLIEERVTAEGSPITAFSWTPYKPEVERYGGEHGVIVAEQLFCESSAVAVDLLRKIPSEDRSGRLGKATLSMLVLLYVFMESANDAASLIHNYGTNYLTQMIADADQAQNLLRAFDRGRDRQAEGLAAYVEAVWEALSDGDGLTDEMDRYRRDLEGTRDRLAELSAQGRLIPQWRPERSGLETRDSRIEAATIFPSYLHMMNNRLGVTVQEECYLAVVIASTLDMTARVATA